MNRIESLKTVRENLDVLKRCLEVQKSSMEKHGYKSVEEYLGFEWWQVKASPQLLNKLVRIGILEVGYKSNKATCYRIPDPEGLMVMIEEASSGEIEAPSEAGEIPRDLFSIIVGHDDVKEILFRSITSSSKVHILLHGSPASAKSLFLEELSRIPGSRFVLGSSLSKAGLLEILFEEKPRYLIIDEIDKIDGEENLSALLSLMERGRVVEAKYRRHRSIDLRTTVYAACNRVEALPPELLSRFLRLRFRDYTPDEFMDVVRIVLSEREKVQPQLAIYIGEKVLRELVSRDPRDAIKVARLLTEPTRDEVDRIVEIIKSRR
ncbi:MAG: AAA family ATPase [Nitrososphaerota archaeon]